MIRIDTLWLCAQPVDVRAGAERRLHAGRFVWLPAGAGSASALQLTRAQFEALVLGLPWQRLPEMIIVKRA